RAARCVMPRISSPAARMAPGWSSTSVPTTGSASGTRRCSRRPRRGAPRGGGGDQRAGGLGAVRAANLRWLSGYREPRVAQPGLAARLREVFVQPGPLLAGAAMAGDLVAVLPVLFGMLWRGELAADVEAGLLGAATLVHARAGGIGELRDSAADGP